MKLPKLFPFDWIAFPVLLLGLFWMLFLREDLTIELEPMTERQERVVTAQDVSRIPELKSHTLIVLEKEGRSLRIGQGVVVREWQCELAVLTAAHNIFRMRIGGKPSRTRARHKYEVSSLSVRVAGKEYSVIDIVGDRITSDAISSNHAIVLAQKPICTIDQSIAGIPNQINFNQARIRDDVPLRDVVLVCQGSDGTRPGNLFLNTCQARVPSTKPIPYYLNQHYIPAPQAMSCHGERGYYGCPVFRGVFSKSDDDVYLDEITELYGFLVEHYEGSSLKKGASVGFLTQRTMSALDQLESRFGPPIWD